MGNRKRKLSDSASLPEPKKTAFLTPQPQKSSPLKGKTPGSAGPKKQKKIKQETPVQKVVLKQQHQNTPKNQEATPKKQTPKQLRKSPKSGGGSNKSPKRSNRSKSVPAAALQNNGSESEDEVQLKDTANSKGLFKGLLQDADEEDDEESGEDSEIHFKDPSKAKLLLQEQDGDEEEDSDEGEESDIEEEDSDNEEEDSDNEEEDSDNEEEDSDNEEEDSDEEEEVQQVKKGPGKKTPKSNSGTKDTIVNAEVVQCAQNRDSKTLFLKNLPEGCSVKEIKTLSKAIKQVRLRIVAGKVQKRTGYAFIEFASEATATAHYESLQNSMIRGRKLFVDFVGEKSTFHKKTTQVGMVDRDPLRLYIAGFPNDTTEADLRKIFPKATEIGLPIRKDINKTRGYGFISFSSAVLAKQYRDKCQEITFKNMPLVVLYARKRKELMTDQKQPQLNQKQAKATKKPQVKKKVKVEQEEESDDAEEDDAEEDMENDDDE